MNVLAGDTDIALGGGYAALNSHLAGSDLQIIFGVVNWFPFELVVATVLTTARKTGQNRFETLCGITGPSPLAAAQQAT